MKKTLFVLLVSTMFMWATIRDGMAQAPDISVSVVMSKSAYDITTTDAEGQVEPIIMAINIKNNSGVDLVVSSPFRPVVAGGNGGNIHLDLTFTNQDGFAVTADEFINQTEIPPPVVINEVPMDRVEIWPAGDEFTITLPNAYAYYPDLFKGKWKVDLLKTLRFYSEFQNINSILYSPIETDPVTDLPIITEVTITASNFVTLVADEDGDGFSWPIVMSLPADADALLVDCDDSPSGADGILGTNDDGEFINPENLCEGGAKLTTLTLVYNGLDCSAASHTQDPTKTGCDDFDALEDPVWIGVNDRSVWGQQQQNVWFPATVAEGWVNLGATFELNTGLSDLSEIKGNTVVHIFDAENPGGTNPNANLLQKFSIHTSCSDPLTKCDQFGAVHVFEGTQVVDDCCGDISEEDIALINLIESSINSSDLKTALNGALSLSDCVLNAAINRSTPMVSSDLKDVLLNASPLTECVLQDIVFRVPSMNSSDNKVVLLASSPLPPSILEQVIAGNPPMDSEDLADVLNDQ